MVDSLLWRPVSEEEIRQAAAAGSLEETHYFDIKRELKSGPSANKELAKDIAAFSEDGGVILIGVDEKVMRPTLTPVDTTGMPERIEQIARMRVDEPVTVSTSVIASEDQPGLGYLVVSVPASPRAHMAGGRYYGRGDKTNQVLSHPEVLRRHERLLALRRDLAREVEELLSAATGTSPVLVGIAEPQGARADLLVSLAEDPQWQSAALNIVEGSVDRKIQEMFSPSLARARGFARRAEGVAVTIGMPDGRFPDDPDHHAAELVFGESGRLVLTSQRAVFEWDFSGVRPPRDPVRVVFDELIVGHLDMLVRAAGKVAETHDFVGSWRFAVGVNGLWETRALSDARDRWGGNSTTYSQNVYTRVAEASFDDIGVAPRRIVEELVAPLLRGLDAREYWSQYFGS